MVLQIPQLHNFSPSIINEVVVKTGCQSVPDWKISVQQTDDIAWSVVLSFLISPYHRREDDFARRLKQLTGSDKDWKSIRKAIESYNPFKNRYSCFYNETLRQVVKAFKINLNWDALPSVSSKLDVVSARLCCPVVSMWKIKSNMKKHVTIYTEHTNHFKSIIILYTRDLNTEENKNSNTVYNFLLDHELGLKMKNAALLYFLKEAKMFEKEIRRIELTVKKRQHFLISLLTSGCQDIIPKLYKSAYVVSKLNEAGFETDPRTRDDDGFSALHHALILGDLNTVYALYYFAANNCVQSECSYRNPDCRILNNLHEIEKILLEDRAKAQHHPNYDNLKETSDDLLGLNKFLIEVNRKVIKIKNEFNYYESTNETVFEACERRDIIISVLDTYQEFFKPIQTESTNLSPLDDYVMFKNYYNLIDMTTVVMFFDNIVLLKERLVLDDKNQFSEIESSLLFSVIYHVVFERENFLNMFENISSVPLKDINTLYLFPLMNRLQNKNKIEEFSKNLRDTVINYDNVVELIPRSEIHSSLNSHPVFKDYIHLNRLKGYIKTAVNVKVTDVKSVLVIQRALQVIGEYITPEDSSDYTFRRFFSLILPKKVSRILRRTRHELSHLKSYVFKQKFESEKNFSLFRSIQKEIRLIQFHFRPVFQTQSLYKYIVLMKEVQKQYEQIKQQPHLYAASPLYSQGIRINLTIILKDCSSFFLHKYRLSVEEMLITSLNYAENNISSEINWSNDSVNLKNTILYTLWPLKWIVEVLKECGKTIAETQLNDFKTIEDFNPETGSKEDLKIKTNNFLIKCKDLLFMPHIKRKRVLKRLEEIKSIEQFLKILKGFNYLSHEERNVIRQEIPETIKKSVLHKEKLKDSIKDGFTLKIEEIRELTVTYLSNKKTNFFFEHYQNKSDEALAILETPDPIFELEEIFLKNSVDKKKYHTLCKIMQFSDNAKKMLGRLVAGQNKKIPGNNLSNLLNRVQSMKKILIEENGEVYNLWLKIKRLTSRIHVVDTIMWYYLKDYPLQAAIEMLLFDCMSIYESEKNIANPWIKSSKFYCGINLRNVISHGSPLLECLCALLDPEDFPSDMIQKILRLIGDEDSIKAILELYEQVGDDYPTLLSVINSEENAEYFNIKCRILKSDAWKDYALLLPYKSEPSENK